MVYSRRHILQSWAAALGTVAIPTHTAAQTRSAQEQVTARLDKLAPSGQTVVHAVDLTTGVAVASVGAQRMLPMASVAKSFSACWALDQLGEAFQFETQLRSSAPVINGRLAGHVRIEGVGDPVFNTDALQNLVDQLKARGISALEGGLSVGTSSFGTIHEIDPTQPDHVQYNPAVCGMNLNLNRAQFTWKATSEGYDLGFVTPSNLGDVPTRALRAQLSPRNSPVFEYHGPTDGRELWSVAQSALGEGGRRWLPVRRPADYAADVFQSVLTRSKLSHALRLGPSDVAHPNVLARHRSAPLAEIVRDMMKYSTNLTAEMLMMRSAAHGGGSPQTLGAGALQMQMWLAREFGLTQLRLENGSGLSERNRASAQDLVRFFGSSKTAKSLAPLLKTIPIDRVEGDRGQGRLNVRAKTGTLNFVSALSGYILDDQDRPIAFAIMSADEAARDAVPAHKRDNPDGGKAWLNRARYMQREVIRAITAA